MRCSLWAAHQFINQIRQVDRKMADAFSNAGTTVLFGTTKDDAKHVAEFIDDARFTPTVMENMPKHHFVLQRNGGEPVTGETIPMPGIRQKYVQKVRRYSAAQVAGGVHRSSSAQGPESAGSDQAVSAGQGSSWGSHAATYSNTGVPATEGQGDDSAADASRDGREDAARRNGEHSNRAATAQSTRRQGDDSSGEARTATAGKSPSGSRYGDRERQRNEREEVSARIRGSKAPSESTQTSSQASESETSRDSELEGSGREEEGSDSNGAGPTVSEDLPE